MNPPEVRESSAPIDEPASYLQIAIRLIGDRPGTPVRLLVISDSMTPSLRAGDWIEVETSPGIHLSRGDIVVRLEADPARQTGMDWMVHRLVGNSSLGWLTKGDNLRNFDAPIPGEAILGRVIRIDRQGRVIDIRKFQPRLVNRCLGLYNFCLGALFTHLRRLRGRLESGRGK